MRLKEVTVSLDMNVQAKQYNATKAGLTLTWEFKEDDVPDVKLLQKTVRDYVLAEVHQTVKQVYGVAAADYVVNQAQGGR